METITKGSVEPLLIPLRDRLENITSLADVSNLRFDVLDPDDVIIEANVPCTHENDMTAICIITTTLAAYVIDTDFRVHLKFTSGSESPVLGSTVFRIVND